MYVEIAAIAAGACLYVLAAVLWAASRHVPAAAPLRDAAIAEAIVGTGLLIRCWAPHTEYGPVLALATVAYGAHGIWILIALRRVRGWSPGTAVGAGVLALTAGLAALGLVWPQHAYIGLGLAYIVMAGVYVACLIPTFAGVERGMRLPLRMVGACGALCTLMYLAWGGAMIVDPVAIKSHGSGPALAASFLFGLWLNLVATSGYLLLVLRRLMGEIESHALLDPLTGAANRRGLQRHLERRDGGRADAAQRGLIAIDIDHFKQINDRHGHAAGDHVLAACAARLREQLRAADLLARVGGEEFLVLLEGADAATTATVAERLRAALADRPVALPAGPEVVVTISLGTAHCASAPALRTATAAEPGAALAAHLARADRALYRAKQEGRNRVAQAEPEAA